MQLREAVKILRALLRMFNPKAVIIGLVTEGLEEECCARAQGTVGVGFERADAEVGVAEGVPDANFQLIIHAGNQRHSVDTRGQLAPLHQRGEAGAE